MDGMEKVFESKLDLMLEKLSHIEKPRQLKQKRRKIRGLGEQKTE
jgi:hypothetical protein